MTFLPTANTFTSSIKKKLPNLEKFYMSGQWSMTTGGVQSVIYVGRHVIQILYEDEGRNLSQKKTNSD